MLTISYAQHCHSISLSVCWGAVYLRVYCKDLFYVQCLSAPHFDSRTFCRISTKNYV